MEQKNNNSPFPEVVWRFFIFLFFLVGFLYLLGVVYFDHASPLDFINAFMANLVVAGKTLGCLAVSGSGYLLWNHSAEQRRKLKKMDVQIEAGKKKNEKIAVETKEIEQIGSLYVEGLRRGLNVEAQGRKISSPWSNIHTIHQDKTVDADTMKQLSAAARRLTVEEICEGMVRNSYKVGIGSSLINLNAPPVTITIFKKHFKIIGSTQKGKSSFVGALIDIVTRTHDPEFVQFALLDKEYQTSKLFANVPHLLNVVIDDEVIPLHAKTVDEVCEYLTYLLQILEARNAMSKTALKREPLIIIYIEEFLRLKKELLAACTTAQDRDTAKRRYVQFSFAIGQLAGLGLKLKMCLWVVAQMSYADKDSEIQEAMGNIAGGVCFGLSPKAALAAGFFTTELLNRNVQEGKQGTGVVETSDCIDFILAPDFNLDQRLLDLDEEGIAAEGETDVPYTGPYLLKRETRVLDTSPALPTLKQSDTRLATLVDAIEVWNEVGEMGRPRLRKELIARGLECSDDRSMKLLEGIKNRAVGGVGE